MVADFASFGYVLAVILAGVLLCQNLVTRRHHRQIHEKTIEENKRLAMAVDQASDGVVITDPNQPDNPIIYVNTTYCTMTGYRPEEILGRNPRILQGPETNPQDVAEVRRAVAERRRFKIAILNYRKNGAKFWCGLRISPVFSDDGKLLYFLGFNADITERIQMEQALIESKERFGKITSAARIGVRDWDAATDNLQWNESARDIFKFSGSPRQSGLQAWVERIHPEDAPRVRKSFEKAISSTAFHWMEEYRFRTDDNQTLDIQDHVYIVRDAQQKPLRAIGSMQDISERKKLQAQLFQSQKMETVGTLAGGIAHDLNNQLTPVQGYLDLIMQQMGKENPMYELLWEAEQAAGRCQEVVQRLLGFSRSSNQKKSIINLAGVLWELKIMFPKFLPAIMTTDVYFDQELWPVNGNDTEIQTVLMNLATNARDAMPEGGKLSVTAKNVALDPSNVKKGFEPGPYVLMTVTDTGRGIPADIISRIYEPFFTTKKKGRGTGLGLSMVFAIIRDHQGWLDVSSTLGEGTVFSIYLPAKPDAKIADQKQESQALPRGRETILFADDEEMIRNLGKLFLERLGYQVILAEDGENAVNIYRERHGQIGAAILDMTMPKLTGRQMLKKILEINPKAKIILSSGYTPEGSSKELMREGAAEFLQKPYTIGPLSQMLRKVLDS